MKEQNKIQFDIVLIDLIVSGNDVATANAGRDDAKSTTTAATATISTKRSNAPRVVKLVSSN